MIPKISIAIAEGSRFMVLHPVSVVYILPAKSNKPAHKPGIMSNTFKGKKGWWGGSKD